MGPSVFFLSVVLLQLQGQVFGIANVPEITDYSALNRRKLDEDFPLNGTIGQIKAFDPDGTPVRFEILGAGGEYFEINRNTGVVTLKKVLDFDTPSEREILMKIVVTDGNQQKKEVTGLVIVQDANDVKPEFSRTDIFKSLKEDTTPGYIVSPITVTDIDSTNQLISVTCKGESVAFQDACDKFDLFYLPVNISNKYWRGELRLKKPLDYETRHVYAILLEAFDGVFRVTNEIHIEVEDINDSPPIWTRIRPVSIKEEEEIGTLVTQVTAKDGDDTNPRKIFYEIIEGGDKFAIDNSTGIISNTVKLDYDSVDHTKGVAYGVRIKAREIITEDPFNAGNDEITTSTAAVTISLQDIDDNVPTFDKKEYLAFIPENILTTANVPGLQLTITDIDSGTYNSFDLVTLEFQDVFAIAPNKGKANAGATLFVLNSQKIDYEAGPKEYVINVEARENAVTPALTGSATVTIRVQDVNDVTPVFDRDTYYRSVSETAPEGTLVIDLDATDNEAGNLGTAGIRYKVFGNLQNHFNIDKVTGEITVGACLTPNKYGVFPCIDFERKRQYVLTVSATDNLGNDNGRTKSVEVVVTILDENDNIPKPHTAYTGYIIEGMTTPVQPVVIKAIDPDTVGVPVTYELDGPADVISKWQVNNVLDSVGHHIGNITAKQPILLSDADDINTGEINFNVISKDLKYSVTSKVTIFVLDTNNNAPTFSAPNYEHSIREDTKGDVSVITVTASDGDAPTSGNGVIDFSIKDGALGKFTIKSSRRVGNEYIAEIYTTPDASFNYDVVKKFTMTLQARDQGTPQSKQGQTTVVINLIDVNNNVPQITPTSVSIGVPEDKPPNSEVHRVIAIDPDKTADLRYYMNPTNAQDPTGSTVNKNLFDYTKLFTVEENTGIVRVAKSLNRELTSFIISELTVVDIAATPPQTGTGALFITITEVNDQDPVFDLPLYNITIDEELNINYFVRNLHCTDEDDGISRYSLTQRDPIRPNYFALVERSGVLTIGSRIDFEQIETITLTAMCYDDGNPSRSASTSLLINIRNINDNSPDFDKSLYTARIQETEKGADIGGVTLTTVSANDIDKGDFGEVRYKMADPDVPFSINAIDGTITVKSGTTFDREQIPSFGFQVVAYDSPNTPSLRKSTTVPVYLTIGDINDNCPVFGKRFYSESIPESANTGTDMIDITAKDADSGINKQIVFGLKAGSFDPAEGSAYFGINRKSGRIQTRSTLSGKSGVYRFNVTATDTEGRFPSVMCVTQIPVEVTVQKSQNYAPRWIDPPSKDFVIYVLESQYEGMLVYNSRAEDLDDGPDGIVEYFFVEGNKNVGATAEFRINQVTGVIRAEIEYDREEVDTYFLTLLARDMGSTHATSQTTLIVVIMDVDDNDPIFETKDGKVIPLVLPNFELMEETQPEPTGLYLGKCEATDKDSDHRNNRIFYEVITGDEKVRDMVRVNRDTCEIYLLKAIDYETMPVLEFSIYAFNEKNDDSVRRTERAVNPSILPVVVRVTDMNDNPPKFTQSNYFACTPLDSPYKTSIVDLDATDIEQAESELSFSLAGTSEFDISQQGIIRNTISLPSTSQRIFSFTAKVTDNSTTPSAAGVNIFVTSEESQVKMKVNRPSSDVRRVQKEYETLITRSSPTIQHACVEVKNHINSQGKISSTESDVYISVVEWNGLTNVYQHWSASRLYDFIDGQRSSNRAEYESMFISSITTVEDDKFSLDEDVVLAILIVSILLIVFAILLLILACYCIWAKKKKKIKKIKAQRHTMVTTVDTKHESYENPIYHNSGNVNYETEYSTVVKSKKESPINPVVIPAPENLQPLTTFQPTHLEPADPAVPATIPPEIVPPVEPADAVPMIETEVLPPDEPALPTDPEEPEIVLPAEPEDDVPVIETEVLPDEPDLSEPISPVSPDDGVVIETEVLPALPDPEDRIETVVEDENDAPPLPAPPVMEDEIVTEIRDLTPPPSPPFMRY